jgi:hypothetical protein
LRGNPAWAVRVVAAMMPLLVARKRAILRSVVYMAGVPFAGGAHRLFCGLSVAQSA